jgi:hypothetical protein
MRTCDLVPAFLEEFRRLDVQAYAKLLLDRSLPYGCMYRGERDPFWKTWDAEHLLDILFIALDAYALEGTYFGAHPGDGSDFGFWPLED